MVFNKAFHEKLEAVPSNMALTITGTMKNTIEKPYLEPALGSLL